MRTLTGIPVVLAALLLLAPHARADDEPAPPQEKPALAAVRLPFSLDDVAPADGQRPEGWTGVARATAVPATAPSTARLLAMARDAGVDAAALQVRCIPLRKGDGASAEFGVSAWVTLGVDAKTFAPKLAAAAGEHGWLTKNLALPNAVLVTWGSNEEAADALQRWQVATAVHALCEKGFEAIASAGQAGDQETARRAFMRGQAMIQIAGRTEPEAGVFHALMGRLLAQRDPAAALEHNRKALAANAPVPPPARWIVVAAFEAGQALLTKGDEDLLAEATEILERGVAAEAASENHFMRFGNRYNLACAYARRGETDKAFPHLEESLRYLKSAWQADMAQEGGASRLDYPNHFEHARTKDSDLEPLRADPRWAALFTKYDPAAPAPKKNTDGK